MRKYVICLFPVGLACANIVKWQDFENNIYMGGAYGINSASISQFGATSNNSGIADIGATALFNNRVYLKLDGNANFNASGNFIGNWYSSDLKMGYSLQSEEFNVVPYAILGYGNDGAYYSNTQNIKYGIGILGEYMITPDWLIYADVNYQYQSFSGNINDDFNKNVLNNTAIYSLNGTPNTYGIDVGLKYITKGGLYFNPFFKYQEYQQNFNLTNGAINYGKLTPTVTQYQFGLNFGLII